MTEYAGEIALHSFSIAVLAVALLIHLVFGHRRGGRR